MTQQTFALSSDTSYEVDVTPLTIEAALGLPSLRRGMPRVVSGHSNLGRPIRWAHSSEVPNIASLLRGGELLLMTGMGMGPTPERQRSFIRALSQRGVAGVAIELGQVFQTLPKAVVAEADANELPLIELRREVRFVDITVEIHSTIVSHQLELLTRGAELHERLTELMLDGADIPTILAALADTVRNPVVLEKAGYGVMYHAVHDSSTPEILAVWDLARAAAGGGGARANVLSCPVLAAGRQVWGQLVVLGLESELDDFAREALERAVTLIALELLRTREEAFLVSREHGDFLCELASGRLQPADAAAVAEELGFSFRQGALVPLAIRPAAAVRDGAVSQHSQWIPVLRGVRETLLARAIPALVGSAGSEGAAVALLAITGPDRRLETIDAFVEITRTATRRHLGSAELVAIAGGPAVLSWDELPAAIRQATETVAQARGAPLRSWHDATIPDVDRLLRWVAQDTRVREFVSLRLDPVVLHDRNRAAKLLPTLEALAANGWRRADTARALHLNRQSLYPQLRRIELLLGASLEEPDVRLGIELALRLRADGTRLAANG